MLKIIYILFASLIAFNSNSDVIEKSYNSYFLNKVLSESDLKIYKNVMLYQKKYQWEKADRALSKVENSILCLLYTSPSPRDLSTSRMPSSA